MAEEPENLVLEILRRMQGDMASMKSDISGIKRVQDNHTLKLDFLAERVEMLHEGTMAALNMSAITHNSQKKMEAELKVLTRRVENLENAH